MFDSLKTVNNSKNFDYLFIQKLIRDMQTQ
jgi:hypothetical protein